MPAIAAIGRHALSLLLLSAALASASPAVAAASADKLAPCQLPGVEGAALCGTLPVWEDRAAKSGRKIDLHVVVLPALAGAALPDAITYLGGGPGEGATDAAGFMSTKKDLRQHRDILLLDQRGTGKSNPLNCDFYGPDSHTKPVDLRLLAGDLFPPAAVRACRDTLAQRADLKLYTTDLGMDDLDEVRAWLGYAQLDVFGGSYGTRSGQVYLRRHPTSVRTVILDGVAPVDETLPLHHAWAGQHAMDVLLAECAADAGCHAAFPHATEELQAVMARVDKGVTVEIPDPQHGGTFKVVPSRGLIAEGLRFMMYGTAARRVPLAIHLAYGGDMAQLVSLAITRRAEIDHILAMGMNFSVTCAEDLPFITDAEAARATANTLLGDYRIREQKRVCADWPRGNVPADVHQPVQSDAPVLLFSGERDPVTPPEFGKRVAAHLPNGLLVVEPHGSHGAGAPCTDALMARFIDTASVKGLDVSCMMTNPPAHFVTHVPAAVKVAPAVLDGYVGSYAMPGFVLVIVRHGDHLVTHAEGDESETELTAESDHHFFNQANDLDMEVVRGKDGAVSEIVIKNGDQELRGHRKP